MELTRAFNDRWRSQFPETPPPDLLAELKLIWNVEPCVSSDDSDVLIAINRAVQDSERKIKHLQDQLAKELFIKDSLENFLKEISKNNDINRRTSEVHDSGLPCASEISDQGFAQFTTDLDNVCASESDSVLTRHRSSLKHVDRNTNESCTQQDESVCLTGSQSGGDNSTNPKHLTKVNCFRDNKSIFQMASVSNKENSRQMDASKMYGQVDVMSTPQPSLKELSSNSDSLKESLTKQLSSRPGPAVPKKPPKPLPHPRRKVGPTNSLPCGPSDSGTFPKNSVSSPFMKYRQASFEAAETSRGDSCDTVKCANIKSECSVGDSTKNSKHRYDTQSVPLSNYTPTCDNVIAQLVKGVNSLTDVISSQDSKSETSLPAKPEPSMRKFHRHKSDRKNPSLCDETFPTVQGTYRKINPDLHSCEIISNEFQEKDKSFASSDPVFPTKKSDSILPLDEDCVDGSVFLRANEFQEKDKSFVSSDPVLPTIKSDSILPLDEDCVDGSVVFRASSELVTHDNARSSNTRSSLLDNVMFFKEVDGEIDEDVKNVDVCVQDICDQNVCGQNVPGQDMSGQDVCDQDVCGPEICDQNVCDQDVCGQDVSGQDMSGQDVCDQDVCGQDVCGQVVCSVDEQDEAPLMRQNKKHDGEYNVLNEDCLDGDIESSAASNEELYMKHSRLPSYENWTIDRCVTLPRLDDSNESETCEDIYCNINYQESPPSTLQKYSSYKGSKDSGLCDDLSNSGVDTSPLDARDVQDFPPPPLELLIENLDDSTDSDQSESNKHSDSGSLASDIVFIPSSELHQHQSELSHNVSIESHGDHDSSERLCRASPLPQHHLQPSPVPSSGDDELVSSESCDEIDGIVLPESPREKMLKLRQVLVAGVLDSEESYLEDLELLLTYKRSLLASSQSSRPVIHEEDVEGIFSNIGELYQLHVEFVTNLKPIITNASLEQKIGEPFKMLILKLPVYGKYMENYQKAVSKIHQCCEEDQRFQKIAQAIKLPSSTKEVTNLEGALFKPVVRLQRNTLVLHDLIKYTPENHPDYVVLKKTLSLSQHNLENFGTSIISSGALPEEKRYLVKSSFLVELIGGSRKLRYVFLFSDVLVCTKKETSRRGSSFVCKWFTPLCSITRDTTFDYGDDHKYSWREEIEEMKRKIGNLKSDLRSEMKKEDSREKHWSIGGMAAARNVEKMKKKIQELEASLILASPKLPVKLSHEKGKFHTLLMTTDYEREEWMDAMSLLCRKCANNEPPSLTAYDIQELINSVKEQPQVNKLGSVLMQNDEDIFNGTLNVTIHKLNGLKRQCDTYCCLEMDSYDHFFMKARSHICKASSDPSWDEDFELELDGSQTLRVLVYEQRKDKSDELLGRGAMELNKSWLNMTFQERTVVMNEVSLVISVRHTPANKTMRRIPSQQKTAVFGVKISTCTRREGKTVPTIVTTCIQEVEKRGLDEVGIYRVSGVTSEVQKLKKMFDKNIRAACNLVGDSDIHAVTGVLKLYFRELPEPLFTEASYTNFIDALKLADKETRETLMISLLHSLPAANYYTIVTLVEHLVRVTKCAKENKMTTPNLSTVFGPTLLAPAVKETQLDPMEMMSKGAEAVLQESAVVAFFLDLATSGKSLRKSAQC